MKKLWRMVYKTEISVAGSIKTEVSDIQFSKDWAEHDVLLPATRTASFV